MVWTGLTLALLAAAGAVWWTIVRPVERHGSEQPTGGEADMPSIQELRSQLASMITRGLGFEAEKIAQTLGKDAAPVLMQMIQHESPDVRRTALEVAGQNRDAENCKVVIRSLDDPDPEIQNLAAFMVLNCSQAELLPQLMEAMKKHSAPGIRGPLALQVGIAGGKGEIPVLRKYRSAASDPKLQHDLELALARLGDSRARSELVERITSQDPATRYGGLQDCIYVQDKSLARHFSLPLHDLRDIVQLTIPEDGAQVYARICDVAAMVMANLGYPMSFPAEGLERRTHEQLEEARKIVAALPGN